MPHVQVGFLLGAVSIAMTAVSASSVVAQEDPLDAAFARMVAHPNDLEAAFDYARIAAREDKARAAIATLERTLRLNPKLDNIRLELASLYLAAGSPDVARIYAKEALKSPDIPPSVADRAKQLLATAEMASSRSLVQANVFTGFRWDSNATQATALAAVPIFNPIIGATVAVSPAVKAHSDASWITTAQLTHRYDLGLQTEGAWETNFSLFDQRFFQINHTYDLDAIQFDTGPRIGAGEIASTKVSVRPFFSAGYIAFGDRPYATQYGGGLSGQAQVSAATTLDLTTVGRFGNYYDTSFRPSTRNYTGPELTVIAKAAYAATSRITLTGDASYYWAGARQDFYSRQGPGASVSLSWDFTIADYSLGMVTRIGFRRLAYGSPDPFIDPTQKRTDNIFDAGLSFIVPLTERLRLVAQYGFYRQDSKYSVYSFDDNSISLGLRLDL